MLRQLDMLAPHHIDYRPPAPALDATDYHAASSPRLIYFARYMSIWRFARRFTPTAPSL